MMTLRAPWIFVLAIAAGLGACKSKSDPASSAAPATTEAAGEAAAEGAAEGTAAATPEDGEAVGGQTKYVLGPMHIVESEDEGATMTMLRRAFVSNRYQLRDCVEASLVRGGVTRGEVMFMLDVKADGSLEGVGLNMGGIEDEALQECFLSAVQAWTLQSPGPEAARAVSGFRWLPKAVADEEEAEAQDPEAGSAAD